MLKKLCAFLLVHFCVYPTQSRPPPDDHKGKGSTYYFDDDKPVYNKRGDYIEYKRPSEEESSYECMIAVKKLHKNEMAATSLGDRDQCMSCNPTSDICPGTCQQLVDNLYWSCEGITLPDGFYFDGAPFSEDSGFSHVFKKARLRDSEHEKNAYYDILDKYNRGGIGDTAQNFQLSGKWRKEVRDKMKMEFEKCGCSASSFVHPTLLIFVLVSFLSIALLGPNIQH